MDDDQIKALIENNPHQTTRDITEKLRIFKSSDRKSLAQIKK